MIRRITATVLLLATLSIPPALAGGKRGDDPTVSFHLETTVTENPKMIFGQTVQGETRAFSRMPEIATRDIQSFNPFPSDDGTSYGIVFQLKEHAARRLSAVTASVQEQWLVSRINGRPADAVLIDKQINDGTLVVWQGVTLADIEKYDKILPRIGAQGKKKK